MSVTKRDVLLAICEHPGWQPTEQSSTIDRWLSDLQAEGWIVPRLDGWEASPAALDSYPDFAQADIANPHPTPARPSDQLATLVPLDRVAIVLAAALQQLPLTTVAGFTTLSMATLGCDKATWAVARTLARRLASDGAAEEHWGARQ